MPEGHVTHRLAGELTAMFGGRPVRVSSPQGRFAESAALLDGSVLTGAEAVGKNLFVTFDAPTPENVVSIHLGLIGKLFIRDAAPPVGQVRLRITDGCTAADLFGPQLCALTTPDTIAATAEKLGADPLRADADPERAWQRVHKSGRTIASLLMDQKVTAGVGNIYRAEVLFLERVNPMTPGNRLTRRSWDAMWADLVRLMPQAVRDGRIDTVRPEHEPEAMGRPPRVDRHGGEVYVYRRVGQPCLVCGNLVRAREYEGRNLYWCATCQRRR